MLTDAAEVLRELAEVAYSAHRALAGGCVAPGAAVAVCNLVSEADRMRSRLSVLLAGLEAAEWEDGE